MLGLFNLIANCICTLYRQLELRRSGVHLCVGLSCLESFHPDVTEIWTRFDIDIVNFDGEVVHTQGAGASHFSMFKNHCKNVCKLRIFNFKFFYERL